MSPRVFREIRAIRVGGISEIRVRYRREVRLMPVLIEAISVVIRRNTLEAKFPGGWDAFQRVVPNRTMCTECWLLRGS